MCNPENYRGISIVSCFGKLSLKTLISINGKVYIHFVDYQKAFDNLSLVNLLTSMVSSNINGQILSVINEHVLKSEIDVKQGNNLSPLLFSILEIPSVQNTVV